MIVLEIDVNTFKVYLHTSNLLKPRKEIEAKKKSQI